MIGRARRTSLGSKYASAALYSFYLIYQFLALAEVKDVLEGGEGDVMNGLAGEEGLMGGNDDVGHHQQQSQSAP